MRYRNVMALALRRIADEETVELAPGEEDALGRSLPDWRVFPEVPAALDRARANGFRLSILSNSDPELIQESMSRIGVSFDDAITASEIGSYKPAHEHWRAFADRHGRLPDVHVGASLFHDVGPANELEIPSVWVNRLAEQAADRRPTREIGDLAALPGVLDELVPS
jgi:2-haloalkanoic acid dehalogenase type II